MTTGLAVGIGVGPFATKQPEGSSSALDAITSSNGAYWVVAERGTNYVAASDDMSTSPWSVTRASYDQPAQKLIEDTTAAATHYIEGSVTLATTTTYTVSFEAKPAGRDWAALVLQSVGLSKIAYFDLANGTLGASNDEADATITAIGDGWYRCTLFDTTTSAGSGLVRVYLSNADADFGVLNGDGSSGIYLRHPQVEAGASFTAYEETTGTALGGALLDQTGGGRHLLLPGGTANPVLLDHSGTDYFWTPGTTGNTLTAPDIAAYDVTTSWKWEIRIASSAWSSGSRTYPLSFGSTLFGLTIETFTAFRFYIGASSVAQSASTAALPVGTPVWVKVEGVVGAGSGSITFSTGTTDTNDPDLVSYTQLSTHTGLTIGPIGPTNGPTIGSQHIACRTYRARCVHDGTTVLDVNASDADPDATTFTEASSNAATVTINRSSTGYTTEVVDQPQYAFATDDYLTAADAAVFDAGVGESITAGLVYRRYHGISARFIGKRSGANAGFLLNASNAFTAAEALVDDGPDFATDTAPVAHGTLKSLVLRLDRSANEVELVVAGVGTGSPGDASSVGSLANSEALNVMLNNDGILVGAFVTKQALTDAEISDIADALITANGGTP